MKKLMLVAAVVLAPMNFAAADDAKKAEDKAKPVEVTGPTFPEWDQRKAGETLDLSGGAQGEDKKK